MIFDWDLWPWMVADGYGGLREVFLLRCERTLTVIGRTLLAPFQQMALTAAETVKAFATLNGRAP